MADETTTDQYESRSRLHEAIASFEQARDAGQDPKPQAWLDRYPEVARQLADFFADHEHFRRMAGALRPDASRVALAPGGEPETFPEVPGYQILEVIGWGGMGVVYKARQLSADRIVALKVIRPDRLEGLSFEERRKAVERFITEAQAAAKLEHENIVHVYEVGEVRGRPFYSMRYVVGTSLHDLIQRGPLEGRQAAGYLEKVARAVHEAHRHGILHRDLKPHNVLLSVRSDRIHAVNLKSPDESEHYEPLVADFGLAKLLQGGREVTGTGDVMGTPPYMSPEQAQGSANVTVASDVYGLGATLYAVLTGRPPFQAATPLDTILQVLDREPEKPHLLNPKVHRDIETICLKCLEKEPRKRYASAEELADRLRLFLEGKPIPDRPITRAERLWRWCRRNPILATTGCIALAGVIAVVILSISFGIHANRSAENESQAAADLRDEHAKTLTALDDAKTERRKAEDRLVRMYVANGVRLMDEGDLFGSLPWFFKALEDEKGGPEREEMHRMRLGVVLPHCPKLVQLWVHEDMVRYAVFSPDGRRVLTVSGNGARVWDATSGQPVSPPLKHILAPESQGYTGASHAAFSPDGRRVVTASEDQTARVWDAATGQPVSPPLMHNGPVAHAGFSPDGGRVVTASYDQTARVWDVATGQPVSPPLKHNGIVWHAGFSADGRRLVTASYDQTARVWDAVTGQPVSPPLKHNGAVRHAAFSPDGGRVVTASHDQTARVWDAVTGQPVSPPLKHNGIVWHAGFSTDGRRVVTASRDGTARVWDAVTGQPVSPPLKHNDSVYHAAFSTDGRRVVTASDDGTARVWDAATGQPVSPPLKHNGAVRHAVFSPDGGRVVTASTDKTARVWDAVTSQSVPAPLKHNGLVSHAEFSPDGRRVVTASRDGTARVWDAVTGQPVCPPLRHNDSVNHAAFSPDSRRVVTASNDHTARVWDAATGQPVSPPLKHNDSVYHAAFSTDGRRVVTASRDGTARVWDAVTGQPVCPPLEHNRFVVHHAEFSPDGRRVVTASTDKTARVWDAATGEPVSSLKHHNIVFHAAFSPDGGRVVTASDDETARVWDAATGQPLSPPLKHNGNGIVRHAGFSADGRRIVTASGDHTGRVWDAATGEPVSPPLRHNDSVNHAAFSPDSRRVVTASNDHTARVWDLQPEERPLADWRLLSQVLSGQQVVDATEGLVRVEPKALESAWHILRGKYPSDFSIMGPKK